MNYLKLIKDFFMPQIFLMFFGAMGSWNNSPPFYAAEKGLESEYQNLSSELLTQIRLALLYSVNEW